MPRKLDQAVIQSHLPILLSDQLGGRGVPQNNPRRESPGTRKKDTKEEKEGKVEGAEHAVHREVRKVQCMQ